MCMSLWTFDDHANAVSSRRVLLAMPLHADALHPRHGATTGNTARSHQRFFCERSVRPCAKRACEELSACVRRRTFLRCTFAVPLRAGPAPARKAGHVCLRRN